ncbi:MAG: bifunctional oligoribonuclease/PAP phosphatase NrnA [Melioribacteraceae bacterium]
MLNYSKLFKLLNTHSKFIITCHVNPDGDAIGSEIAIAGILKQLKKEFIILNTSSTPYNLEFLYKKNLVQKFDEKKHTKYFENFDAAIFLDLNDLRRTAKMEKYFREFKGTKICIDHHLEPEDFTKHRFIDRHKSSTGEIVLDFINSQSKIKLNKDIAQSLYAAILTDTGSFRFPKTTPELHRKVAVLLEHNVKPFDVYDKIYGQDRISRNKLLGNALSSLELSESGKISYMVINQKHLKQTNADESDVNGFINFGLSIAGVKVALLFFELKDGIKISFRSKGNIPVNKVAKQFGGGGHKNASGLRMFDTKLSDVLSKVIDATEKIL